MTQTADTFWKTARETAAPYLAEVDTGVAVVAIAALFGGYLGARLRGGRGRRRDPLPAPPMAPRPEVAPIIEAPPRAVETPEQREAQRIFKLFRERFNVEAENADSVLEYLETLATNVGNMQRKLSDAEREIEKMRSGAQLSPAEAPWELVTEASRLMRGAAQALRGDPDFDDLNRETGLDDMLRKLTELRASKSQIGGAIDTELIEQPWPHQLFRIEALTAAYYPTTNAWRDLRIGLALGAAALRQLFRQSGLKVEYVRLLSPLGAGEGEVWDEKSDGLRDLAPVRRAVVSTAGGIDRFVIDCDSFGYHDEARSMDFRSKVITYNRAHWRGV
ncbi:MAG: hypothetical protein AAFV62_07940 [Pseudomonadota bacterium]